MLFLCLPVSFCSSFVFLCYSSVYLSPSALPLSPYLSLFMLCLPLIFITLPVLFHCLLVTLCSSSVSLSSSLVLRYISFPSVFYLSLPLSLFLSLPLSLCALQVLGIRLNEEVYTVHESINPRKIPGPINLNCCWGLSLVEKRANEIHGGDSFNLFY